MTPRIVLDTNTLVSALLFREGGLGWLRRVWQVGHLTPLACGATLIALVRVLASPKFHLGREEIEEFLADFVPSAETAPNPDVAVAGPGCRDPNDQVFLALAIAAGEDALVTKDIATAWTERRDAMRAAVADLPGSDALHLDFYDRTRMATWVRSYPGVVLWVLDRIGQPLAGWRPWGNWSRAPAADSPYLSDDTARLRDLSKPEDGPLAIGDGIARLRARLREPGGMVRLTGLSGKGKTRLLETLSNSGGRSTA